MLLSSIIFSWTYISDGMKLWFIFSDNYEIMIFLSEVIVSLSKIVISLSQAILTTISLKVNSSTLALSLKFKSNSIGLFIFSSSISI